MGSLYFTVTGTYPPLVTHKSKWLEEKLERTLESQSRRLSLDLPEQVCSSLSEGSIVISRAGASPLDVLVPPPPCTAPPSWSTSPPSAARHQRRRGAGHADQGHHCRRRSHPPHPQVPHRQEGRGSASVECLAWF